MKVILLLLWIKLLDITIDQRHKFDKRVETICKNAVKQFNIMYTFEI